MANTWPWASSSIMRGARSAKREPASRVVQRSWGSSTWLSAETTRTDSVSAVVVVVMVASVESRGWPKPTPEAVAPSSRTPPAAGALATFGLLSNHPRGGLMVVVPSG